MTERVVEVSSPAFLMVENRQLAVKRDGIETGTVPIEDIGVLILDGYQITLTFNLIQDVLAAGAAIVFCDEKHNPSGLALNMEANSLHTAVLRQQAECSVPKKKRVWQQIVQAKIDAQANLLRWQKKPYKDLLACKDQVRSGDPANFEAQVAAIYFERLFGKDFVRERDVPGTNALLNYGYAIVRAMVARALVGAGLHPALGVHHRNQYNPYCLADDAMEPLRPLVDQLALDILKREGEIAELTPTLKKDLLKITVSAVNFAGSHTPIGYALARYAASLKGAICEDSRKVMVPIPWRSMD